MDNWEAGDVSYMPTDLSCKAIGNFATDRKSKASEILNIKTPLKTKLLIPYVYNGHYRLLFLDIKEETFAVLDPYENSDDEDRVFEAFLNYARQVKEYSTLNNLKYIFFFFFFF